MAGALAHNSDLAIETTLMLAAHLECCVCQTEGLIL